jgi:hypothetical protein
MPHGIVSYFTWTVPKRIHRAMTAVATPDERIGQPGFVSMLPDHLQQPVQGRLRSAAVPVDRMGRQRRRWRRGAITFATTTVCLFILWLVAKRAGTANIPPLSLALPLTLAIGLAAGVYEGVYGGSYAWQVHRLTKGKPGRAAIRRDVINVQRGFWYFPGHLLILDPLATIPRREIAACTLHTAMLEGESIHLLAIHRHGDPIRQLIAVDPAESIEGLNRFMTDCGYPIRAGEPIELRGAEA